MKPTAHNLKTPVGGRIVAERLPGRCNRLQCAAFGQIFGGQDAQNRVERVVRHG